MNVMAEIITETWMCSDDPCFYYGTVWKWFQNGELSKETWDNFTMTCLEFLMEKNKDILDRLKNV